MKTVKLLGWIFLLIGILGFIPGITSDGMLLGIFAVNGPHNIVHILTGLIAISFAKKGEDSAKAFAKIFGVIYAIVAVWGLLGSGDTVLGLAVNGADNILHIVIALLLLIAGFSGGKKMDAGSSMGGGMPQKDANMGGNDSMGGNMGGGSNQQM